MQSNRPTPNLLARLAAALFVAIAALPAMAQSPFSPAVRIDDSVVTYFEINQRAEFYRVLRQPGDNRADALEALVNERLQAAAAESLGLQASPEAIEEGVAAFAERANLGPEQFLRAMAEEGIAPETIRDFVASGVAWRNVVQQRFGQQARVTDEEVARAIELGTLSGGPRVLLAEIVVPQTPENEAILESELARLARDINGNSAAFSEAARRFSAAPTREAGGVTGWRPLSALPPGLRSIFLTMSPGQVTDPIAVGPAYAIFQLRGLEDTPVGAPDITGIDYLTVAIPGGRTPEALAEAERLRSSVDTCDDFYGVLPGGFERQTLPVPQIPSDIAVALSALDDNEMSTSVTTNGGTVLLALMLCGREVAQPEGAEEEVRQALFAQRLEAYASGYLEELRADARIEYLN